MNSTTKPRTSPRKRLARASRRPSGAPPSGAPASGFRLDVELELGLGPLAVACSNVALGYAVTAKHAGDEHVADHAVMLADAYRSLSAHIAGLALSLGGMPPRTKATCGERLRWEWLASSARLLDGAPDERLLAECARAREAADVATLELQKVDAVKMHPAMRQIHATLVRARNAAVRLAHHSTSERTAFAAT